MHTAYSVARPGEAAAYSSCWVAMYEKHFGLKSRPFGSKAEGPAVFVGPRQAKMITSLQKGIAAPDAVVTVTGPVGSGKTTIVDRALETLPTGRTAARIGRMQLSAEEVVDLVMGGFGIKKKAGGAIQRFAAFRRILQQQAQNGIPVALVIEDAQRLGVDALAEVEALTAADNGDAASGNIILMGQPGLHDLLMQPELGRLKQRLRLRLKVESLTPAEVQGYLKHAIRGAGGDYDAIFDSGVADIVFGCSEGVPRMINTLCETAMTTAMEENSARVTAALMGQVASDAFGYDIGATPVSTPVAETDEDIDWEEPPRPTLAKEEAQHQAEPVTSKPPIGHDIVVESGRYPIQPEAESAVADEVAQDVAQDSVPGEAGIEDAVHIAELINDTQPELPRLNVPSDDPEADIPVLDIQASESDTESPQAPAQSAGLDIDGVVGNDSPGNKTETNSESGDEARDDFDLDAALSPDVESTNVMPGITTNLDSLANEKPEPTVIQEIIEPVPAPEAEQLTDSEPAAVDSPAEPDLPTLSDSMRVRVAKEAKPTHEPEPAPVQTAPAEKTPEPQSAEEPKLAAAPLPEPEPIPDIAAELSATPEPAPEATTIVDPDLAAVPEPEPESESEPQPKAEPEPAAEANTAADAMLHASPTQEPMPVADPEDSNADIDALEAALEAANSGDLESLDPLTPDPDATFASSEPPAADSTPEAPEITLDKVISDQESQLEKLDQFRDEMSKVNSLEDVSDVMAETLFGVEFDEIAAAAVANPDFAEESGQSDEDTAPSPVALSEDEIPVAANDASELQLEQPESPVAVTDMAEPEFAQPVPDPEPVNDATEPKPGLPELPVESPAKRSMPDDVPLNDSTALRIDMLNEMKAKAAAMAENVEMGSYDPAPAGKGPQPEPIERQINTSMTQTLEALNVAKMEARAAQEEEEKKEEKKSGGLFSRFRKSS